MTEVELTISRRIVQMLAMTLQAVEETKHDAYPSFNLNLKILP